MNQLALLQIALILGGLSVGWHVLRAGIFWLGSRSVDLSLRDPVAVERAITLRTKYHHHRGIAFRVSLVLVAGWVVMQILRAVYGW